MENIKGSQDGVDWEWYLKSSDRILIGYNTAIPNVRMDHLIDEQTTALNNIEVVHILTLGENRWLQKQYKNTFTLNALFLGKGTREAVYLGYPMTTHFSYPKSPLFFVIKRCRLMWLWFRSLPRSHMGVVHFVYRWMSFTLLHKVLVRWSSRSMSKCLLRWAIVLFIWMKSVHIK